jgi:dipeptidyl-peptidase-4
LQHQSNLSPPFTADYYLYDIASKKLKKLFDFQVQEPTFLLMEKNSAKENNLFVYDVTTTTSNN